MKYFILIGFILFGLDAIAQDMVVPADKRAAETNYLRQTVLHIDGLDFDYRVLKHYAPDILQSMPVTKRKQVYFLYTASYLVLNSSPCSAFDPLDIDVASLDIFRNEDSAVVVEVGDACKVQVQLMSRADCRLKMEELVK